MIEYFIANCIVRLQPSVAMCSNRLRRCKEMHWRAEVIYYVFSDAARDEHSTDAVREVRECIKRVSGFNRST